MTTYFIFVLLIFPSAVYIAFECILNTFTITFSKIVTHKCAHMMATKTQACQSVPAASCFNHC